MMPCKVRKEVLLEPRRVRASAGARIRFKRKHSPYFQKKTGGRSYLCSKSKTRDSPKMRGKTMLLKHYMLQ